MRSEGALRATAFVALSPCLHPKSELAFDDKVKQWFRVCGLDEIPRRFQELRDNKVSYTAGELRKLVGEVLGCVPLIDSATSAPRRSSGPCDEQIPPLGSQREMTTDSPAAHSEKAPPVGNGELTAVHSRPVHIEDIRRFLDEEIAASQEAREEVLRRSLGALEADGALVFGKVEQIVRKAPDAYEATVTVEMPSRHSKFYSGTRVIAYQCGNVSPDALLGDLIKGFGSGGIQSSRFEVEEISELSVKLLTARVPTQGFDAGTNVCLVAQDYGDDYLVKLRESLPSAEGIKKRALLSIVNKTGDSKVEHRLQQDSEVSKSLQKPNKERPRFVQGPPGTGKTWLIARLAIDRVRGRHASSVLIVAKTNSALREILAASKEIQSQQGSAQKVKVRRYSKALVDRDDSATTTDPNSQSGSATLMSMNGLIFNDARAARFDSIIVDEASQLSLAELLFVESLGPDVVFVGDPRQLGPVVKQLNPDPRIANGLLHVYHKEPFHVLTETYRLNPDLADAIGTWFYEGQLKSRPDFFEPDSSLPRGVWLHLVTGDGDNRSADEEADAEADQIKMLVERVRLIHSLGAVSGNRRSQSEPDIVVSCLYRQQVTRIEKALGKSAKDLRVDSVERTQGTTATYLGILSTAGRPIPSDPARFAWVADHRRLNVAISRSRTCSVVFASREFLEELCSDRNQDALSQVAWKALRNKRLPTQ